MRYEYCDCAVCITYSVPSFMKSAKKKINTLIYGDYWSRRSNHMVGTKSLFRIQNFLFRLSIDHINHNSDFLTATCTLLLIKDDCWCDSGAHAHNWQLCASETGVMNSSRNWRKSDGWMDQSGCHIDHRCHSFCRICAVDRRLTIIRR